MRDETTPTLAGKRAFDLAALAASPPALAAPMARIGPLTSAFARSNFFSFFFKKKPSLRPVRTATAIHSTWEKHKEEILG